MTLVQMEQQMAGVGGNFTLGDITGCGSAARHLLGIPSLCIQTYRITNGPPGIGTGDCAVSPKATALPSDLALTASFDPALALAYGNIIGEEARSVDVQVVEGPGMDMLRVPQGGRSFEYASEDPFLAGTMVTQIVKAEQSNGIIGMCKHFQGNEQEIDRQTVSDIITEQSRNEIYFTPFRMCVKDGGALAVMCAYNLVGGIHQCQDPTSLTDALRTQWGFPGYVQSDFGATNATAPSILAGENMEMNSAVYFTPALLTAALAAGPAPLKPLPGWVAPYPVATGTLPCGLKAGQNPNCITPMQLQTALQQRYAAMFTQGIFDRSVVNDNAYNNLGAGPQISAADGIAHGAMARSIADQSAVLFKNAGNVLPLKCSGGEQTIALVGPASLAATAYAGGGGSSQVSPIYSVTALAGLQAACPTATIKEYTVSSTANLATAAAAAAAASLAIVIVGDEETEGSDRATVAMVPLSTGGPLPDTIVETVHAAQPNTVVVLVNGDPVTLPWANSVPAILEVLYPGEEYGDVIADLLYAVANPTVYGPQVANPSGKSPMTFPVLAIDVNASTPAEYPGLAETLPLQAPYGYAGSSYYTGTYGGPAADLWVSYSEGLNIGYRWYDAQNITPQYCFGFGLSYSTFTISNVAVTPATDGIQPITVTATVTNTGAIYGAEVVQAYLGFPETLGEPPRRLAGFQKIWLNPGQSGTVTLTIDPTATNYPLSYWDTRTHNWAIQSGTYSIYVGNSSGLVGNSPGCTGFAYTGAIAVGKARERRPPIR
jgi:beta-glucosidase